jgi:hypothetical protein
VKVQQVGGREGLKMQNETQNARPGGVSIEPFVKF